MARLTDLSFELAGSTYKLALDFDDAALVQDTIAFDVVAERTRGKLPSVSVHARVEINPAQGVIVVYVAGQEVFRIGVFDNGPTKAEQFIQRIPAHLFTGDPILGCAVKAGISSIIGQAIDCCRSLETDGRWRVVSEFLRCMSQNFGKISRVAMFRAFKCIVSAGLA